jgi:tetratricopeptide (TPR) repeat protein
LVVVAGLIIVLFLNQNLQCSVIRNLITVKLVRQAIQINPSSGESPVEASPVCGQWVYAALGFNAWEHNDWEQSLSHFQTANALRSNIIYLKRIGDIYHILGDESQSLNYWFQAGDYRSLMETADKAYRSKQWDLAKNGYQLAVNTGKMGDDEYFGHFELGNTLWHGFNDIHRAEAEYLVVINERPNYLEAYLNLGDLHYSQKDIQGAMEWFQKAIGVNPKSPKPYYYYALMEYRLGDYPSAKDLLTKSLDQNPDYEASLHLLGVVLKKLK